MSDTIGCLAAIPLRSWLWTQGYVCGSAEARARLNQISTPINATEQANITLGDLDNQINKYDVQASWRIGKIAHLRQEAKTLMLVGKKQEALGRLKEAKIHVGTLQSIQARTAKFTAMGSKIMEATMNREDSAVFQSAASSLSMLRGMPGVDVDKVEEVMAELEEIVADVGESSNAISRPLDIVSNENEEVYDDDLEEELEALMSEGTSTPMTHESNAPPLKHGQVPIANIGKTPGLSAISSKPINTINLVPASQVVPAAYRLDMRRPMASSRLQYAAPGYRTGIHSSSPPQQMTYIHPPATTSSGHQPIPMQMSSRKHTQTQHALPG